MLQRGRPRAQACYTFIGSRSGGMVDAPVSKTGGIISRVSSSLTFGTIFSIRAGHKPREGISKNHIERIRTDLLDKFPAIHGNGPYTALKGTLIAPGLSGRDYVSSPAA